MTPRNLAEIIDPYGIDSRSIRMSKGDTPKGYLAEQFAPLWQHHLGT
jgi:hypothetical protein